MSRRDTLNLMSKEEIAQLSSNIQKLEFFVDKNVDKEIQDIDLSEGQTLLSLIDSQIPNASIQTTFENRNIQDIFYVIRCGVVKVQEYLVTQVEVMQLSSETELLRSLLDLVDLVSSLIARVDFSTPGDPGLPEEAGEVGDFTSSYLDQTSEIGSASTFSNSPTLSSPPLAGRVTAVSRPVSGQIETNPFAPSLSQKDNAPFSSPSSSSGTVISRSMYMLRRMADRAQTLRAVQQLLIKFSEMDSTGSRAQMKEIHEASVLQTLLSALARSADWPDVELLIAKAVCFLVPLEEDPTLLLKNSLDILNALFVFQLKSAEQAPSQSPPRHESDASSEKLFSPVLSAPSEKMTPTGESSSEYSGNLVGDSGSCSSRTLVAEALAKLIYILCREWKKQDISAIAASNGIRLNTSISMNINSSSGGLLSTNASVSGTDTGPRRPRSLSASLAPLVDANHTLVQILTIVMLVCDMYKQRYSGVLPEPTSPSSRQRKAMLESMHMRPSSSSGATLSQSRALPAEQVSIFLADNSIDLHALEGSVLDDTAIIVSASLCYLAELPQCRPALVSGGVLRLLRIWIEAGGQLLLELKRRLFEETAVRSVKETRVLERLSDLLCNCTRAMMFILGGSLDPDLVNAPGDNALGSFPLNNNAAHQNSSKSAKSIAVAILNRSDSLNRPKNGSIQFVGYEYMVGRIDADLLSEDIPAVLVRFVATMASVLSYDEITKTMRGEAGGGTGSQFGSILAKIKHAAFSKQVVLHLAQSLFQLSSRGQNRAHLLSINAPHAIFSLLWDAVVEIQSGLGSSDRADDDLERNSVVFRVASQGDFMDDYSGSRSRSRLRSKSSIISFSAETSWQKLPDERPLSEPDPSSAVLKNRTQINHDTFIRTVAQYCLDSISFFVSDSQVSPTLFPVSSGSLGASTSSKGVSLLLSSASTRDFSDELGPAPTLDARIPISTGNSIVDMLANVKIMETFKYVLTTFPRGRARLSALKVISSMTDWRECVPALHQADIIDALLVICFESDKLSSPATDPTSMSGPLGGPVGSVVAAFLQPQNQQPNQISPPSAVPPPIKKLSGFGPLSLLRRSRETSAPTSTTSSAGLPGAVPPRPKIERGVSYAATSTNNSSLFGDRTRLHRHVSDGESDVSSTSSVQSGFGASRQPAPAPAPSKPSVLFKGSQEFLQAGSSDADSLFDDDAFVSVANEEMLTVTYALANICLARPFYAKMLLNKGLLEIMLGMYNVLNLDNVNLQVLRCISALCPYLIHGVSSVALSTNGDPTPAMSRQRKTVLRETLGVLSRALKSNSLPLQREAITGLAGLSGNTLLHRDILEGPLRQVVSLLLAREYIDTPVRAAAEAIVKNLGFIGGVRDLELVGYDLDVFRDWFLLREALEPQEAALVVLRCWLADLFEGTNYSQLYNMPRSPGRFFDNAFGASAPELHRAQSNPILSSPDKRSLAAAGLTKHSNSFTSDHSFGAGRMSYETTLNSASEDESTLDGSVASPMDFGRDARRSKDEKLSPRGLLGRPDRRYSGPSDVSLSPAISAIMDSDVVAASETISAQERVATTDSNEGSTGASNPRRKLFLPFLRKPASAERGTSDSQQPFASPGRGSNQPSTARGNKLFKIAPSPRQFAEGLRRLVPFFLSKNKSSSAAATSVEPPARPAPATASEEETVGSYCHDILGSLGSLTARVNFNELDNNHSYPHFPRNYSSMKGTNAADELTFGLDLPPPGVLELLDLYYPSKMHHACFMDLTSLYSEDVLVSDFSRDRALPSDTASAQVLMLALPTPHAVCGVSFQPRQYSFSRIGRVVERMIEEGGSSKRWSLSFQDNSFSLEGVSEFHTSLMQMLRKCPQIVSLSFTHSTNLRKLPDSSAHLGHMAGNVPPSIRFMNFRGVLSSESLQALCILLRRNNFIYTLQGTEPDYLHSGSLSPSNSQHQRTALEAALMGAAPGSPTEGRGGAKSSPGSRRGSFSTEDRMAPHRMSEDSSTNPRDYHRTPLKPSKGLLGLAITHTPFTNMDIKYLIELLAVNPNKSRRQSKRFLDTHISLTPLKSTSKTSDGGLYSTAPRGVRYLDLSYDKLGDQFCADILNAAAQGPLEGLDLSGNNIHRGKDFCDLLPKVLSPTNGLSYLRYLGLSNNALQNATVCQILDILQVNELLTTLDLSCNDIQHSKRLEISLRNCVKLNRGLRVLDLSFNKLNADLVKCAYLGLLENEYLLMMPLAGNPLAAQASELSLIEDKLTANRQRYRAFLEAYNDTIRRAKASLFDSFNLQDPVPARRYSNSAERFGMPGPIIAAVSDELDGKLASTSESSEIDTTRIATASEVLPIAPSGGAPSVVAVQVEASLLPLAHATRAESGSDSNILSPNSIGDAVALSAVSTPEPVAPAASPARTVSVSQPPPSLASIGRSISFSASGSGGDTIRVFFSAPLVWRDQQKRFHPLEMLDYKSERDSIVQVLSEVHRDISVSFQFATTDNLRTALSLGCRALHFSGHGHPSFLNFEDGRGGLQIVRVELLRDLLRAGGLKLDFVFVSACHSRRTGEAFVDAGVPHVVCVKVDAMIQDSAANAFTRAFYLALIGGKSVQSSFEIARQALKASPYVPDSVLEGEKFILLPDGKSSRSNSGGEGIELARRTEKGGPHDRPIFQTKSVAVWNSSQHIHMGVTNGRVLATGDSSNSLSTLPRHSLSRTFFDGVTGCSGAFFGSGSSSLPPPPPDFEGREVDMYRVITTLLERRLVSLVGSSGVGKTALTTSLCTYVADRTMFPDGVFYMRVTNITSHSVFLTTLLRGLFAGPNRVAERLHEIRNTSMAFQSVTASILAGMRPGHLQSLSTESLDSYNTSLADAEREDYILGSGSAMKPASSCSANETVFHLEELIVTSLSSLQVLLVLDHVDDLLHGQDEAGTDLKFFLGRLFDRCHQVKVLVNSTEPLGMRTVSGFGVVENSIALGPLTLRSSIRLYARLAPSLLTSSAKASFIASLLPPRQHNVTATSRELTRQAAEILGLFGNGHPAFIVKQACESSPEDVDRLMVEGARILSAHQSPSSSLPSSAPPSAPPSVPGSIVASKQHSFSGTLPTSSNVTFSVSGDSVSFPNPSINSASSESDT